MGQVCQTLPHACMSDKLWKGEHDKAWGVTVAYTQLHPGPRAACLALFHVWPTVTPQALFRACQTCCMVQVLADLPHCSQVEMRPARCRAWPPVPVVLIGRGNSGPGTAFAHMASLPCSSAWVSCRGATSYVPCMKQCRIVCPTHAVPRCRADQSWCRVAHVPPAYSPCETRSQQSLKKPNSCKLER